LAVTQIAQMAVMTTDVIMLGRLGKSALASAAIGMTVYYFAWLIGVGPVSALAPMISQAVGREAAPAELRRIARMGVWSIVLVSGPLAVILLFARPILLALGQDPELAAGAGRLVSLLAIGLPFSLLYQALRNICAALGRPTSALWVMAATILFNAAADYTLIFGHFGCPPLGLAGAGLATSASAIFSALAMAGVMQAMGGLRRRRLFRRFARFHSGTLGETLRLGMPIGLTMIFEAMLFNTMTLVMGAFGSAALAAHQIALNVASLTFMAPLGIAMAATIRVGAAAGAKDWLGVRRAGITAMALGCSVVGVFGLVMALFGEGLAGLYLPGRSPADWRVIVLAGQFLKVAAAFQMFDALQVVAALSLRGLKDARAPLLIAGASYWLVGAPLCLGLAFGCHLQGLGVWIGLALGLAAAAASMTLRFFVLSRPPRRQSADLEGLLTFPV
jgi:MATE family multidrug resistance protein